MIFQYAPPGLSIIQDSWWTSTATAGLQQLYLGQHQQHDFPYAPSPHFKPMISYRPWFAVEAPVGVGFSYSDNPNVDYNTDDNQTALDNYHFLVEFFKNFPEYKDHDFYVA